jgi:hypothetical protein
VQSSDPGAVGAYKGWLDTTTNPPVLKYRNAGDSAWVTAFDLATVGAETATSLGALVNGAGAATPNDTDLVATAESGGLLKKITWTNAKAFLKTYFDTLYATFTISVNAQTGTTYTLQASDNGKIVTCDNAAGCTVTVPSGLGAGFHCQVIQLDEEVDFDTSGATLNNRQGHTKIAGQYGVATIEAYASNVFVLAGDTAA